MCRLQWILVTLSEYISTEVNKLAQTMTKLELLDALKAMTVDEQLEILEVTSKIIRDRLSDLAPERLRERTNLEIAAEKMHSFYAAGTDLTAFTDRNTEDFYEYTEYA
jgi:H2-forming N5,N10-methylenetetrahydromethanopterin dehydrogenase-like enzyme